MRAFMKVWVLALFLLPASAGAAYYVAPQPDNVLFIPGTEASRLYMKDASGTERQLWEPSFYTDIPLLAMNPDGTSVNEIYTKDIVDSLYGNDPIYQFGAGILTRQDLDTYGGFETFMNELVSDGTIKEWRAYPYDWRYDVRDVVENGTLTKTPEGSIERVYLEDLVHELASTSKSGQVTIVAHSNGGLVAKALMMKLEADGEPYLIGRIVLIGTPQWGTPAAIGAALHGDNVSDLPRLIVHPEDSRAVAAGMGDTYDLLPSSAYFAHISDPVVSFDSEGALSKLFVPNFGNGVTSFDSFLQFIEDSFGLNTQIGDANEIHTPLVLKAGLADKAKATHDALDTWTPHPGLEINAIVGWGQETIKTLAYKTAFKETCTRTLLIFTQCFDTPYLQHVPVITQDGDGTVVSPSAVGDVSNSLYFNAARFRDDGNKDFTHQNMTSAPPIEKKLLDFLKSQEADEEYVAPTKPTDGLSPLAVISTHSPVNITITDANGNQTGVIPFPGKPDFSFAVEHIPGSFVYILDDEKYVFLPNTGTYRVEMRGYGEGMTTLEIGSVDSTGVASTSQSFANIPTTASTTASFEMTNGVPSSPIQVDIDGDGTKDLEAVVGDNTPAPPPPPPPPEEPPAEPPPPAVPEPPHSTGGGGGRNIFFAPATTTPTEATTTAATSTPPIATSTPPAPKKIKRVAPAPKPKIIVTTSTPQTASALNAVPNGLTNKLYAMWSTFTHALSSALTLWK